MFALFLNTPRITYIGLRTHTRMSFHLEQNSWLFIISLWVWGKLLLICLCVYVCVLSVRQNRLSFLPFSIFWFQNRSKFDFRVPFSGLLQQTLSTSDLFWRHCEVKVPEFGMVKHEIIEYCFLLNIYFLIYVYTPHLLISGYNMLRRHNSFSIQTCG